jgi:hypothetical protein
MYNRVSSDPSQRRSFWQKKMAAWQAGRLSAVEFCRREGLAQSTFYAWKLRLGVRDRPEPRIGASADGGSSQQPRRDRVRFVEVTPDNVPGGCGIEVVCSPIPVVRLYGRVDRTALAEVLAAVRTAHPC